MGDFADMAIDSMLAMDYHQMNGDYDDDDDPIWSPFSRRPRVAKSKTCKRCGKTGLYWHQYLEGWRLQEAILVDCGFGTEVEFVKHECQLNFKSVIGKKPVDSDPDLAYNAYLDSIPSWTEEEYKDVFR